MCALHDFYLVLGWLVLNDGEAVSWTGLDNHRHQHQWDDLKTLHILAGQGSIGNCNPWETNHDLDRVIIMNGVTLESLGV